MFNKIINFFNKIFTKKISDLDYNELMKVHDELNPPLDKSTINYKIENEYWDF